jgi:REP element-mobilizing transposase RayT
MNKWYGRTGHLFQGDYAADQVKDDAHLVNLIQYIHSNPVNATLVTNPCDWEFSDYREWIEDEMKGIQRRLLRDSFFRNGVGYEKSITEYMRHRAGNL